MGDYSEHILFGLLIGFLVYFFSSGLISLTLTESIWSVILLLGGAVIPDIDHPNSYVRRSFQALVSISLGLTGFFLPFKLELNFLLGAIFFLFSYLILSRMRTVHRGFFHSFSFGLILSSAAVIISVFIVSSAVPGLSLGIGFTSHLLLDEEFKLS